MRQRRPRRGSLPGTALLAVGLILAVFAAGCARQPTSSRATVSSCIEFGVAAVKHHVTVTSLPPQCQGLTKAQIDFAVGSALHSAAIGAHGKAAQRKRIAAASHFLAQLATTVPRQSAEPPSASSASGHVSRSALGLLALLSWLITVAFGLRIMVRWLIRRRRHPSRGRFRRPPPLNFAHLGLAVLGLPVWIAYLATGMTSLAWIGCVFIVLATGSGMMLVFMSLVITRPDIAVSQAPPVAEAGDPAPPSAPRRRRTPVLALAAHILLAVLTACLTFLTAIGVG